MDDPRARRYTDKSALSAQIVLGCTLLLMVAGAVSAMGNQSFEINDELLKQATRGATATADIHALADRMGKVEGQINYVLMGIVGSIVAQLAQFRIGKRT